MSRMLYSPGRYIQGPDAIKEIGLHAARLGNSALLIGGSTALSLCGHDIAASLTDHGVSCHEIAFQGVSSRREIERLTDSAKSVAADFIISLGGGASIDAGKAVAHQLNSPVIVVPTVVATDAPCSALSVIYTDAGIFESYLYLRRNPDCVLVDTKLVANSPAKFLVAGMGDALAAFWESDTCNRGGRINLFTGGYPTIAAGALSRLCYDTLRVHGLAARQAVEQKNVTPSLEAVVEANILLSGLSSENGGHAGAHAIHNGLTNLEVTRNRLHGEKVAFGVLSQLVLEKRPSDQIREVQDFCYQVGLPVCLADLGISNPTDDELRLVAECACAEGETIHAGWFPVSVDMVAAAIRTADNLGKNYRQSHG